MERDLDDLERLEEADFGLAAALRRRALRTARDLLRLFPFLEPLGALGVAARRRDRLRLLLRLRDVERLEERDREEERRREALRLLGVRELVRDRLRRGFLTFRADDSFGSIALRFDAILA